MLHWPIASARTAAADARARVARNGFSLPSIARCCGNHAVIHVVHCEQGWWADLQSRTLLAPCRGVRRVATRVADAGCFPGSQDLSNVPKLPNNMYLRMASIFHSLHAISSQVGAHYRTTTVAMRG